jgi:hypothetical protein
MLLDDYLRVAAVLRASTPDLNGVILPERGAHGHLSGLETGLELQSIPCLAVEIFRLNSLSIGEGDMSKNDLCVYFVNLAVRS